MAELKQAVNRFDSGIPSQLPATSPIKDPPRLRDSLTTSTRTVPQEVIRKQAMADVDRIRIVSTNDFLDKILPIDSAVVDRIYADVMDVKQKLYNQGGRWNDFPPGGKKKFTEVELYSPFVAIANKIAAHARKQHGESDDQVLAATWVDYHSRAPQSLEPDAVKIRPDCVLAIGGMARTIGDDSDPSMPVSFVKRVYVGRSLIVRRLRRRTPFGGYSLWLRSRPSATTTRTIENSSSNCLVIFA